MNPDSTDPGRFERVKAILLRVADLSEAERQVVLDRTCEGDLELRREVEDLLACDLPSPTPSLPIGNPNASAGPEPEDDGTSVLIAPKSGRFTPGQILGGRYRIVRLLGRGGMGEVWQAYDLKLQVDVALKSIRAERFQGDEGLELLRREVRAAREVLSPNVCRIFDLVDAEGHEFVSMEYIDGETLLEILEARGPLDLNEATRIASQFLAGLEAIHQAGLVHRDVKPENVMVTRTGRVVLMDFGIAKGIDEERRGTIAGTPAYMAPEHIRGEPLDARADIFAAGVMLAEMGAPGGIRKRTSRESIWKMARQTPVRLYDGPWRGILERAASSEPSMRYQSARDLVRALEEVALRVDGAEEKHPYPGLHSFTAADAEFFFGREVEVEAVWKKLQRSNLLAIIGASGAGKTSFLHAGLLPAAPAGWGQVTLRPGSSPFVALARALLPQLAGDAEAMGDLLKMERSERRLDAVMRWRRAHEQVLIVVDQFEELFTLCRPEVQQSFAEFLGRAADEGDIHILLLMRDDFLIRCHEHPALGPILSDLTALSPPAGFALRRALVQPALLCGYRFEDETLADEMIAALEGERGALPMLAFAAARLWEERDRERGLLTREACRRIGGVSGALAQHAEATLQQIGAEREPIVREIFRNLVTAQNTRAVADADELLSVFPDRKNAAGVLRSLIDARLLTTFEHRDECGREVRRVEIVHESLLSAWPRLARWRTQDADGVQLRDQLRQAARLWKSRGESDDLLWSGTVYRDYQLWRGRYPGGLTETEEAFARAMTARAGRQRRRRRAIVGGTIVILMLVAAAMAAFGVRARIAQHLAEADNLVALGRLHVDEDPRAALAYATASLERTDTPGARLLATEALACHAAGYYAPTGDPEFSPQYYCFSPDGSRLAVGGGNGIRVYFRDGSPPFAVTDPDSALGFTREPQFASDGDRVVSSMGERVRLHIWSVSQRKEVRVLDLPTVTLQFVRGGRLFLVCDDTGQRTSDPGFRFPGGWTKAVLRVWDWDEKEPEVIGRWDLKDVLAFAIDPSGRRVAYAKGNGVYLGEIGTIPSPRDRLIGEHPTWASTLAFDPSGTLLASGDVAGGIRLWSLMGDARAPIRAMSCDRPFYQGYLAFTPSGEVLAAASVEGLLLWHLRAPAEAEPALVRCTADWGGFAFDPTGQWIAARNNWYEIALIPAPSPEPCVLPAAGRDALPFFTRDGRLVTVARVGGDMRVWDLTAGTVRGFPGRGDVQWAVLDPLDRYLIEASIEGMVLVDLADGRSRSVGRVAGIDQDLLAVGVSPDGRTLAGALRNGGGLRIVDPELDTGRTLDDSRRRDYEDLVFDGNDRLLSGGLDGIRSWDLRTGRDSLIDTIGDAYIMHMALARKSRLLFVLSADMNRLHGYLTAFDLKGGSRRSIVARGDRITCPWVDDHEEYLATGDLDGFVRVGPIDGGEPYVLWRPPPCNARVRDGLVASGSSGDSTVYVWHIPKGRSLCNLPTKELLTRLHALTNFRIVPDPSLAGGYRFQDDPFPGWEKVPEQ